MAQDGVERVCMGGGFRAGSCFKTMQTPSDVRLPSCHKLEMRCESHPLLYFAAKVNRLAISACLFERRK